MHGRHPKFRSISGDLGLQTVVRLRVACVQAIWDSCEDGRLPPAATGNSVAVEETFLESHAQNIGRSHKSGRGAEAKSARRS